MNLNKSLLAPNLLLKLDAWFLIMAGTLAGFADLLSYLTGKGVWGMTFYKNPLAIGFFEAHMLAIIIGLFLFRLNRNQDWNFAMVMALLVHLTLGVSNIIWFDGFSMVNAETMGTIATVIHFVFVSLYVVIWLKPYLLKSNEKA
jgi:hypothetical protein